MAGGAGFGEMTSRVLSKNQQRRVEFSSPLSRAQIRLLASALYQIRSYSRGTRSSTTKLRFGRVSIAKYGSGPTTVVSVPSLIFPRPGRRASHAT